MSLLEAAAVAFGIVSVYLSTRQKIWSWPTAIVNVLLYTVVFYGAKLYADMGLQFVYAVINAYGWRQWLRGGERQHGVRVTRTPAATVLWLALAAGTAALVIGNSCGD